MTTAGTASTRRDAIGAALGLLAVILVSGVLMAVLLSFLTSQAPGLFNP